MEVHVIRFQERVGKISKLRDVAVATIYELRDPIFEAEYIAEVSVNLRRFRNYELDSDLSNFVNLVAQISDLRNYCYYWRYSKQGS